AATSAAWTSSSCEGVGEIPSAQLAWLQADEKVVARRLGVLLTRFRAEVTRGDTADDRPVFQHAEARCRAELEAAVGRAVVANDDARARISPKVPRLPVTRPGHDVKAVVAPLVPDR